jgi:hypothetical protein
MPSIGGLRSAVAKLLHELAVELGGILSSIPAPAIRGALSYGKILG